MTTASKRLRTPDVWWPECGNYEHYSKDVALARTREYESNHHVSNHERFCNRVYWNIQEFLEMVSYPLLDDWLCPVYCFGDESAVVACDEDKHNCWANINDPGWLCGDLFRRLNDQLLLKCPWQEYSVSFNTEYSESTVILQQDQLAIDGVQVGYDRWDREVKEWARHTADVRERLEGWQRRELWHLKDLLPGFSGTDSDRPFSAVFAIRRNGVVRGWLRAPCDMSEWTVPSKIVADDFGPYTNDEGLLSPSSMYRDNAASLLYVVEMADCGSAVVPLSFVHTETGQRCDVNVDIAKATTDEELLRKYPARR
jgi:hypothetical protein